MGRLAKTPMPVPPHRRRTQTDFRSLFYGVEMLIPLNIDVYKDGIMWCAIEHGTDLMTGEFVFADSPEDAEKELIKKLKERRN